MLRTFDDSSIFPHFQVPVQRVTRYPLLLARLMKVTPVDHFSREELQLAHEKVEQHLEQMNKVQKLLMN
jgi:hypothetical protein